MEGNVAVHETVEDLRVVNSLGRSKCVGRSPPAIGRRNSHRLSKSATPIIDPHVEAARIEMKGV